MEAAKAPALPTRVVAQTTEFLRGVRGELTKVTWPGRDELWKATRMILALAIALGLIIGWLDLILNLIFVNGVAALAR